ncbi:TBC1 domain family member 20 isoform X2 [Glossina fuscipes]|uniref:TBC1 domain family member 20 isoform X2 n=1 Tax=Glossina fuscipes TaxID=7396 RepID=A0A9C5ZDT8_9MUSC|nr:TBC1 domain family member 20 isoform X2 [Glossina fuscipes]
MSEEDAIKIDQPQELSFEEYPEISEEIEKRHKIEKLLLEGGGHIEIDILRELARSDYGLVTDDLRRTLWPALVGVDVKCLLPAPKLCDFETHPEYNQVVLDVNRSLKRFPPGIPYEQRIALQDQLTVLIMRVICKYPDLRYYQGYHDVAVTFLLVAGEEIAFAVMDVLSTNHFSECMQETMDATQRRLLFIWPVVNFENPELFNFLQHSGVGTMFALPWYLTWFGHSLNSYKAVVRLADELFLQDCDMASIHLLLSKLPENLPIEQLLNISSHLYDKYPMTTIKKEVERLEREDQERRKLDEKSALERRKKLARNAKSSSNYTLSHWIPQLLTPKSFIVTTAFSIFVGFCAYYYKSQYMSAGIS